MTDLELAKKQIAKLQEELNKAHEVIKEWTDLAHAMGWHRVRSKFDLSETKP